MFALLFSYMMVYLKKLRVNFICIVDFCAIILITFAMFDYLCGKSYWRSNYRKLFLNGLFFLLSCYKCFFGYPDPSLVNFMIYYSLNIGGYMGIMGMVLSQLQTEWIVYILKFPTNPAPPWVDGTNLRAKLSKFVIVGMTRCHVLLYSRV